MPYNFGFKPYDRPLVNAPIGAFSGLADTLTKKYNEGELITDAAKEYFGSIDVVQGDQIARNELADGVNTGLNQLVGDYSGAYESKQFQRDAKAYIRRMARDNRIPAMLETKQAYEAEKETIRKATVNGDRLLAMGKPTEARTTFDPETGQWNSYVSPLEVGKDWYSDALKHVGNLPTIEGTTKPMVELLDGTNIPMVKVGQYKQLDMDALDNRVKEVLYTFAESNEGGNQLARKIASDNGVQVYEDGKLNPIVAEGLVDFLRSTTEGSGQMSKRTMYDYKFVPQGYLGSDVDTELNPFGGDRLSAGIIANPIAKQSKDLPRLGSNSRGVSNLSPKDQETYKYLESKKYKPAFSGDLSAKPLTDEEQKDYDRLKELINKPINSYVELINSYRDKEGKIDRKSLDNDYLGLVPVYNQLLREQGVDGGIDAIKDINPDLLKSWDNAVTQRYETRRQNLEVLSNVGIELSSNVLDYFKTQFIGEQSDGNVSRLRSVMYKNETTGEPLNLEQLAEEEGFDLSSDKSRKAFKESIQLVSGIIPLHDNSVARIAIGNNTYTINSDSMAKRYNAETLSSVSPILRGEKERVDIPGGYWEADEQYDANNNYIGNGAVFYYDAGDAYVPYTLEKMIQIWEEGQMNLTKTKR